MVASPFPAAVTTPLELTAATGSSEDVHVKVFPEIASPLPARAVAVSWAVSPIETRVTALGVTVTVETTGETSRGSSGSGSVPHENNTTAAGSTISGLTCL